MNNSRLSLILAGFLVTALSACAPSVAATPPFRGGPTPFRAAPTAAPAATQAPSASSGGGQPGLLPVARQMIIKNADIELLVADSRQALSLVSQMAADDGGYVISTQTTNSGDLLHATLQLAVPAGQFEAALYQLRGLSIKVLRETTTGQDVSAEYTDLQSRLDNLEATAARVRTFLDASKTVEDSLRVNSQLSDLEGQIEQIKGQMRYDEGRSAFSTVTVTLTPDVPPTLPQPEAAWNPAVTFAHALTALGNLLRASTDATIWLVVLGSPLIAILVAVVVVRRMGRGRTVKASG